MRKSLWIIFALILVAIAAPNMRADSFTDGTLNFTVVGGGPAPTGSFVFDNTTSTFTSFTVSWDGATWDFVGVATSLGAFPSIPTGPTPSAWIACGPATTSLTCAEPPKISHCFFRHPSPPLWCSAPLPPGPSWCRTLRRSEATRCPRHSLLRPSRVPWPSCCSESPSWWPWGDVWVRAFHRPVERNAHCHSAQTTGRPPFLAPNVLPNAPPNLVTRRIFHFLP